MARHSPSTRSFFLLCRCGFFADADAIPSLQRGGLTFLLRRDSSASPSAETTQRRWRAPQFAPPHDSRARAGALLPLHPSTCARSGASPPLPPSARAIEWPLPTGAPDRHGLVKMQVDSGVLGHLIYDGVANNDSSRHQPLPPPSSSTAVVTSGLRYWRNGILGLGPAPWFCLAVVTDNRPWGGSQAPTTIWAEFGPGGR
jgi:hypothetical protein